MSISDERFNKIFQFFLVAIAVIMILRKPCTWLLIAFAVYNLMFYRKLRYTKEVLILGAIVASPLLLELLFFWNNESVSSGLKSLEKGTSFLLFPLFILGNYRRVEFKTLLQYYSALTPYLVVFLLARFYVYYPAMVHKYMNGIDMWQAGYEFARSFGTHAPWLNMHLCLVSIINLYLVFDAFQTPKSALYRSFFLGNFALSFLLILIVNTRMALGDALIGYAVVYFYQVMKKQKDWKKTLRTLAILCVSLLTVFLLYLQENPYMREKYFRITFNHMDKIGRLDEVENPEAEVFNSFVTRVSIWKSAWELGVKNLPLGVGAADAKPELFKYYRATNQKFLAKYDFPTHDQYLDYMLRFGIMGVIVAFGFIFSVGYLGYKMKNAIMISFFIIFVTSNITDDYLIIFEGIAFSSFWMSVFASYYLQEKQRNSSSVNLQQNT